MTANGNGRAVRGPQERLADAVRELAIAEEGLAELGRLQAEKRLSGSVAEVSRLRKALVEKTELIVVIKDLIASRQEEVEGFRTQARLKERNDLIDGEIASALKERDAAAAALESDLAQAAEAYRKFTAATTRALNSVASHSQHFPLPGVRDLGVTYVRERVTHALAARGGSGPEHIDRAVAGLADRVVEQDANFLAWLRVARLPAEDGMAQTEAVAS